MNKIEIPLDNGYKLVAEQNTDSEFNKEIYIGIETPSGVFFQDICTIRPTYSFLGEHVVFDSDKFEMLIYGDAENDDFTQQVIVPLRKDNDE